MAYVDFDRTLTEAQALQGDVNTIYFTADTQCLIMGGKVYGPTVEQQAIWSSKQDAMTAITNGEIDAIFI